MDSLLYLPTLLALELPWHRAPVQEPVSSIQPAWFDFLERHADTVFPALGVGVLVLIAGGVVLFWRSHDMDGLAKAAFRRDVILELRRSSLGVSAEVLSRALRLEPLKTVKLLEEMQHEGILVSEQERETTRWRLKGP